MIRQKSNQYIKLGFILFAIILIIGGVFALSQITGLNTQEIQDNVEVRPISFESAEVVKEIPSSSSDNLGSSSSNSGSTSSRNQESEKEEVSDPKEVDRDYFTNQLNLTKRINTSISEKLSVERQKSEDKVNNIIRLARITQQEQREEVTEELILVNEEFLERFETIASEDEIKEQRAKIQLENYVQVVKENQEIKLNIEQEKIKEFFDTGNVESFIESLMQ